MSNRSSLLNNCTYWRSHRMIMTHSECKAKAGGWNRLSDVMWQSPSSWQLYSPSSHIKICCSKLSFSHFCMRNTYKRPQARVFPDVSYSPSAYTKCADTIYVQQSHIDRCIDTGDLFCWSSTQDSVRLAPALCQRVCGVNRGALWPAGDVEKLTETNKTFALVFSQLFKI